MIAGAVLGVLVLAGGAFLLLGGDDDAEPETELSGSAGDDTEEPASDDDGAAEPEGTGEAEPAEPADESDEVAEVDNSDEILAVYQSALTAFSEADCATLDEVMLPGAPLPVSSCALLETALGNEYEFTDVELVSQTPDEAFVSHTLFLTTQGTTDELQGVGCVVLEEDGWMVANFHSADPAEPGCVDQLLEEGEAGAAGSDAPPLGDPTPAPTGAWLPFHDELAQNCHDGNMVDCDYIYDGTTVRTSDGEGESEEHITYGATCGGRLAPEDAANGECATWYGGEL